MGPVDQPKSYLTIEELSSKCGLSVATLHRYVRAGKLPYLQPGGKGCRLLFAPDVLEKAALGGDSNVTAHTPRAPDQPQRLSGRRPDWMTSSGTEPTAITTNTEKNDGS